MVGDSERLRASGVITALLDADVELARQLVVDDEDPHALAWGAVVIAAGLWEHHVRMVGKEPKEAWAACLLAMERRS